MTIGEVIRKYRKEADMTQEEIANRLGVTTPAVNKWENNNTQPDIALLAPIARLLRITTDELLSFKDELTNEEIGRYLLQIQKDLEEKSYNEVFISAKQKIEEYPNCEWLIFEAAVILDARRMYLDLSDKENYDDAIFGWYERCLSSKDEKVRSSAADSLFNAYFNKENYEKALHYVEYFSRENPERKRKEALVYSKTGRKEAAYRSYEELLFSGYQHLVFTLNDLRVLYMEDDDHEMANKLVEISSSAAAIFEMGRYNEVCCGLDNAAFEKDVERTEQIMRDILDSVGTISVFTKSRLYKHMTFKEIDSELSNVIRQEILKSLDDETYNYMQGNEYWESLKKIIP